MELFERIEKTGVLPVIKIENAEWAEGLSTALCRGGIPAAEITFRTDAAEEAIRITRRAHPEMLIAAGTVLTPDMADRAMKAGAECIVSPGLNPAVVAHCVKMGYPVVPGVCTPSEIEQGLSFGLKVLKFFPAEASGGLAMIRALAGPYGGVRFMPTGGINQNNIASYLADKHVLACGGTWMVPGDKLKAGDFDGIEALVREAAALIASVRG